MKLETNLLVGSETKKWLADFTLQLDRFEALTKRELDVTSPAKKAPIEEDSNSNDADDDFKEAKPEPKVKKKAKASASFDDEEEMLPDDSNTDDGADEEIDEKPAKKAKAPTLEEVNQACKARALRTTRAEVLGILKKQFKVKSVSELLEDSYGDVIKALK